MRATGSPSPSTTPDAHAAGLGWLRDAARRTLESNWREGVRRDGQHYAYCCPSVPRYRHQWYWDSCFHAIAWAQIEPARGRAELRTLLRSGTADGFIPHTVFWDRPAGWRRAPFYATHAFRGELATATIQTPLIALAWERVAEAGGLEHAGFATEGLRGLERHYDWLQHERDPDDDGLISILHPDESGLDDAPKYDAVWGWMRHESPGYFWLVERSRRLGYRSREILARWDQQVEDVLVNVFYALSLRALARLRGEGVGGVYGLRAQRTEAALMERCWDERHGLFFDLAGRDERRVERSSWSALAPLALGDAIPEHVRRRLVEEHLLDDRRYRAAVGIPSVSMDDAAFNPRFDRWRTWRGPSWVNTAWLLVPPMRELGYDEDADRIVGSLCDAIGRHGFREYYNPHNGEGYAAKGFGWSTLVIDLV